LLNLTANALKIAFFRRVVPAAGLADLHFHDLRHETISRLGESGLFHLLELQAISGHRDTRMLQRYTHLCAGKLAAKMDDAVESTTRVYFHRGRRRQAKTLMPMSPLPVRQGRTPKAGGRTPAGKTLAGSSV
jgi:hypothetical protein